MKELNEGIILSSIDYKESSKIVYLYTKQGKKSVLVLGGNKYDKGFLGFKEPLNLVSFEATNANLPKLVSYDLLDGYKEIKDDFNSLCYVQIVLELINKLQNEEYTEKIYNFSKLILEKMKNGNSLEWTTIFLIKMLKIFGIEPNFKNCVKCGSNLRYSFSLTHGGYFCKNCGPNYSLDNSVDFLYHFSLSNEVSELGFNFLGILREVINYYQELGGIVLKSYNLLGESKYGTNRTK